MRRYALMTTKLRYRLMPTSVAAASGRLLLYTNAVRSTVRMGFWLYRVFWTFTLCFYCSYSCAVLFSLLFEIVRTRLLCIFTTNEWMRTWLIMSLNVDILTSKVNQFTLAPKCTNVINLVIFSPSDLLDIVLINKHSRNKRTYGRTDGKHDDSGGEGIKRVR